MALPTSIALHIVTPDQSFTHDVDEVSLPGAEGDFGVLPGHTPFFTSLRTGQMWYRKGAEKHYLAVSVGFVEVLPAKVTVIAQVAERAEDLDQARAEAQGLKDRMEAGRQELDGLIAERKQVRTRIEKLLGQMDLLSAS